MSELARGHSWRNYGEVVALLARGRICRPTRCRPTPLVLCQRVTVPDTQGGELQGLEPLLSIDDVARLLRVSESSVYRLVRSGDLGRGKGGGGAARDDKRV